MFDSLDKIHNPLARSLTAATAAFSAVTITSAIVIGVATSEDESAHKLGVYASLLGAGCGAVLGLVVGSKPSDSKSAIAPVDSQQQDTNTLVWRDWRNFVVFRKVKESEEITSFYLKPSDGNKIPNFQPGQFLTIKLNIPEHDKPIIRTYSLSDYLDNCEYYRISIKRELAPSGLDVAPGIASNFMHDQIQEGSVIQAKPPSGKFILDTNKSLPAVLISNGVGITPMISMAKAVSSLNPNRHIWFIHGARNGQYHAFREEIIALGQKNQNLHTYVRYSRPQLEDEGKYHSIGYADTQLIVESVIPEIENICGSTTAEYFLCGSPTFLQSLTDGLKAENIPESRVFFESFSKGMKTKGATQTAIPNEETQTSEIVFASSGKTLTWKSSDGSILEFAEANGIEPPYSCRQGICLTCMCPINEGEVEYIEPPVGTPDEGSVLICISQPKTRRLVLDL